MLWSVDGFDLTDDRLSVSVPGQAARLDRAKSSHESLSFLFSGLALNVEQLCDCAIVRRRHKKQVEQEFCVC